MLSLTFLVFTFCASLCLSLKPSAQGSYYILDLYGQESDLSILASEWKSYNFKSSDGQAETFYASGVAMVGGSNHFKMPYRHLEKRYDSLPEHSYLTYTLSIVVVGDWKSSYQISISADGSIIASFRPHAWKNNKINDLWIDVSGRIVHTGDALTLRISANLPSQTSENTHFGIHNVKLSFIVENVTDDTSPIQALYCPNGSCKYTENQVCPIGCSFCWGSKDHQCYSCDFGYSFNGISCIKSQENFPQEAQATDSKSPHHHPLRQLQSSTLTVDEINEVTDMARISKIGTVWAGLGLQIVNIVYPSNIGHTTNISIKRMFQYLKFLSVSRSLKLELFFGLSYFLTGNIILEKTIPDELIVDMYGDLKFVNYPLPAIFQYYSVQSNFLANMMWVLTFLLITFGIFLCFLLAKFLCRWLRNITVLRFILKKSLIITANLFIAQFYAAIGDIVFFSSLQFRALHSGPSGNTWSIVSMSLCLFIGIVLLLLNFWVIKKLQSILQDSLSEQQVKTQKAAQHKKKCEWVQIFHLDFKETSLLSQSFLLIFMVRSILFNLVVTLLFDHPLTQAIIIVVMNLLILAYLALKRPFVSWIEFFQQIVFEVLLATCNICTLIIAISDRGDSPSDSLVTNIGNVIMGVTLAYSFVPFFFIALHIINLFYKLHKINQSEKAVAKVHLQTPVKQPAASLTNAETNMHLNNSPEGVQLSQLQTQENENGNGPPIAIEDQGLNQNTTRPMGLIPEDSERVQMIDKQENNLENDQNQPLNVSFQGAEEIAPPPQTENLVHQTNPQAEAANIIPTTETLQQPGDPQLQQSLELLDPENAVVQPQSHIEFLKTPSPINKEEEEKSKVLLDADGYPIEIIPGPSLMFEMNEGTTNREKLRLKSYLPPGKGSEPAGTQNAIKSQEIDKSTQPDLDVENDIGGEERPANQINLFGGTAETRRPLPDGPGQNNLDVFYEPRPSSSPRVQSPRVQSPRSPRAQSAQPRKKSISPEEKALRTVEEEKESLEQFKKLTDLTKLDYEWELDGNTHVGSPYFVKTYLERQDPEKDSAGRIFNKRISELVEDLSSL